MKDESTRDGYLVRDLWAQYVRNSNFERNTNINEIRREPEQVHAYLKRMESGENNEDAEVISKIAMGEMAKDDVKMKNYLIKQYQKKRYQ